MVFLLISGTKVFQVGLLSVLVHRFSTMAWVLMVYFLLTLALTIYRVYLLSTNVQFVDLYKYEGLYALSVIQKLVAPFYYVFFMRGLVDVGDPLFYNLNKWVTPFANGPQV